MSQQLRSCRRTVSRICDSLNTYIRHGWAADGLRDSGGSWYLSIMAAPDADLTVLDSAARRPVGAKFGFCFSGGGLFLTTAVEVEVKASFCDGRGAVERLRGLGETLCAALR